jgi:hypothetical protein
MSYWSEPLWEWDLTYELLRDGFRMGRAWDELKQIEGCFLASLGSLAGLAFFDDDDHSAVQTGLGATDGTTSNYTLFRYRGTSKEGQSYLGSETIGFLDTTQPFNLYIDGTLVDDSDPVYGYTLNTSTPKKQLLALNSAPPAGHAITCDMSWLYYVRFQSDSLELEKFMHQLWGLKKITLASLRY